MICRSGGTGRRPGLKIPWVVIPVPVRFRSAALIKALDFQGLFYVVEDDIDKKYSFGYNKKENTERVIGETIMCTAATYKTKDFYFGRTLDYLQSESCLVASDISQVVGFIQVITLIVFES